MRLQTDSPPRQTSRPEPIDLHRFRMLVPEAGYTWLDKVELPPLFADPNKLGAPPYLSLSVNGTGSVRVSEYSPLVEKTTLFCRFKDLTLDRQAILKFANTYGWIGATGTVLDSSGAPRPAVGINTWHREIQDMIIASHLWRGVQTQNRRMLRSYFNWYPKGFDVRLMIGIHGREILAKTHPALQGSSPAGLTIPFRAYNQWLVPPGQEESLRAIGWNHGDLLGPARMAVMNFVNPRLEQFCHPRLYLDQNRDLVGHLTPKNLLGCIWLQFYMTVIGRLKFRICTVCGLEMDVSNSRSTRSMHDSCSTRTRQQRWRAGIRQGNQQQT